MAPLLQGRRGGLPCLKPVSFGLPGRWGSKHSFCNVWNVAPWNHSTQMLYWKNNNNNALCTQRHSRCKLALDKNVYCFDISGLNKFPNEKSFVKKNGRTCLVPMHQWIWPYTTYVFNLMQLQKSLDRYSCYFIIWVFCFTASGFIFHLLWKRQYNSILKPYSIKLHLCNLTNFNRHQNFANGSPFNDTTK